MSFSDLFQLLLIAFLSVNRLRFFVCCHLLGYQSFFPLATPGALFSFALAFSSLLEPSWLTATLNRTVSLDLASQRRTTGGYYCRCQELRDGFG
ncbi:MAG: hypothetical protein JST16_12185 [Bdellovibrionales bacterium]|nr:hypothetical protein [Bdellovibrionales bacterium]